MAEEAIEIPGFVRVRNGKEHFVPGYRRSAPNVHWTEEAIVQAIQKWVELYDDVPRTVDWNPALARHRGTPQRQARYLNGEWPSAATVARRFGTWRAALRAAGYEVARPGPGDPSLAGSSSAKLSRANLHRLRNRPTTLVGPAALKERIREVGEALRTGEPELLQDALLELAATAVAWADRADR